MTVNSIRILITRSTLAIALLAFATVAPTPNVRASTSGQASSYRIVDLPSLGGLISEGRHVNTRGVVAGFSDLAGGTTRHAVLWIDGLPQDLRTLGGLNSAVVFTDFPDNGPVVGIAETSETDPRNEAFSCPEFFPGFRAGRTGLIWRGFVWENGVMSPLETLGGHHSFAAGANHLGQVVGWAQTTVEHHTCVGQAFFEFLPVVWDKATGRIVATLPLVAGDSAGTANAINNKGQIVGISGDCDQAVGRGSARHAVLWENGIPTDIGNLGADTWNTPLSINERGDVVGFAGVRDEEGVVANFGAFHWSRSGGIQRLDSLPGDTHSEAWAINDHGQAVGVSCGQVCSAVVWQDGVVLDLNNFVPPDYRGHLRTARHINNRGMITGQSVDPDTGERRAFLAIPIS